MSKGAEVDYTGLKEEPIMHTVEPIMNTIVHTVDDEATYCLPKRYSQAMEEEKRLFAALLYATVISVVHN